MSSAPAYLGSCPAALRTHQSMRKTLLMRTASSLYPDQKFGGKLCRTISEYPLSSVEARQAGMPVWNSKKCEKCEKWLSF